MRKLIISWIESILLSMDRLDERRPGLKELTTLLAVHLVLFREKIDPYQLSGSPPAVNDPFLEHIGQAQLMETPDGQYGLIYYCQGEASDYLEARGGQGGGYSWEVIVKVVLDERSYPGDSLTYDPEADMLAIYSPDNELLRRIAGVINELNGDRELLDWALSRAVERGIFE